MCRQQRKLRSLSTLSHSDALTGATLTAYCEQHVANLENIYMSLEDMIEFFFFFQVGLRCLMLCVGVNRISVTAAF